MTNFQQAKGGQRDPWLDPTRLRRLWFWSPLLAVGALSVVLLATMALPLALAIGRDQERLNELEERRQEAELLSLQKLKVEKDRLKAEDQKAQLINLVAGEGNGSTFLATLDLEARQSGVKLQLYEPTAANPTQTAGTQGGSGRAEKEKERPKKGDKEVEPPPDPLEEAGLRGRQLVLSARGTYPQLLTFLRRMELLDLLVEQKNLSLAEAEGEEGARKGSKAKELPPKVPEVEVKLGVTIYKKASGETPQAPGGKTGETKTDPSPPLARWRGRVSAPSGPGGGDGPETSG